MAELHDKLRTAGVGRAEDEGATTSAGGRDAALTSSPTNPNDDVGYNEQPEPTNAERASVSALARMVLLRRRAVIDATSRLKAELEDLRRLEEHDLPDAMLAIDQGDFTLSDGTPVKLKTSLRSGNVTDPAKLKWVEENEGKSLIKSIVTLELDREDVDVARQIEADLRLHPAANRFKKLELTEYVHAQTMIGWCNELIKQLKDPPLEQLGVQRITRAQVGERTPKTVELKGLAER